MSDEQEFEYDGPSKSQIKREMHELQKIAQRLVELPKAERARIPLNEKLIDAIATAHRIKSREALRRQIAYTGKVLRTIDIEPIIEALDKIDRGQLELAHRFRRVEAMRDKVVAEGLPALEEVLSNYPGADRQHLRQLTRQITKESKEQKPPAAARKLFKYLRELESER
ncbi:ribosome-associated protein [Sinobacterium caligoides]|uniref:Dual-action ribosomal maturation protein DarP n=1 Tax=Sinobacterium caligoides TaxID=933926 RepID=A0A3N2E1Y8_9GAMM|nr:ribosome biogenesis factor YjgA [Sinobacterium caligoides]ROS06120.1 ribosome-associated protein [Sinobacterium caligoides]